MQKVWENEFVPLMWGKMIWVGACLEPTRTGLVEAGELILQCQSPAGQVNPNPVDVLTPPTWWGVIRSLQTVCVGGTFGLSLESGSCSA